MKLQHHISPATRDALESRFAYRVAARLSEQADQVGADISERLRFARERALDKAREARALESAPSTLGVTASGAALLGRRPDWWLRVASVAPLLVLVAGLMLIQDWQSKAQISVAAEVDTALLSDDLPLNAYRDAGFAEFLKSPPRE
jgi:hypothetical protein